MFKTAFELKCFINGVDNETLAKSCPLSLDIINYIVKIHQKKRLNET